MQRVAELDHLREDRGCPLPQEFRFDHQLYSIKSGAERQDAP